MDLKDIPINCKIARIDRISDKSISVNLICESTIQCGECEQKSGVLPQNTPKIYTPLPCLMEVVDKFGNLQCINDPKQVDKIRQKNEKDRLKYEECIKKKHLSPNDILQLDMKGKNPCR